MLAPEQCEHSAKLIQWALQVAFHANTESSRVSALNEAQKVLAELIHDAHQRQEIARGQGLEA